MLALRAIVCASAGDDNPSNRRVAMAAWLPGAHVDAVLELKETAHAIGVDVVAHRRAAELDCVFEHGAQSKTQPLQFGFGQPASAAAGPDSGTEEAFVRVDVADTCKQRLVEQRRFDGELAASKQGGKVIGVNGERFFTCPLKTVYASELAKLETAESARIDEANFATALQRQARMGVVRHRTVGSGNQEAAGHAKMHNPLGVRFCCAHFATAHQRVTGRKAEFADNMFAGAMYREDGAAFESFRLLGRRCLEWLGVAAEPCFDDAVSADAGVDAECNGLHFRKFRHGSL
jgi:hypothetical protein